MKEVTFRRYSWDSKEMVTVELHDDKYSSQEWAVHLDGQVIGRVGRYTGSLDRKSGRLRIPGKQRTLWTSRRNEDLARTIYEHVSRADAIRWLLNRQG